MKKNQVNNFDVKCTDYYIKFNIVYTLWLYVRIRLLRTR